ncbi:MAG: hypothetical protein JWQ90_2701 [Hydrocarboniphaga sp.]|uniref:hypothetical protein n=1 Tax=Hydrocarboniphaga sp. TaxID=2033016 RepID=UPI00260E2149|nr:hypothetical protein [Hydrocarboniphaga sp.]MDB5970251.1 hypothetical protein [Hydrocarboniphaga sp.]
MGSWIRSFAGALLALASAGAASAPLTEAQLPAPLRSWVPWVLGGDDPRPCPLADDSSRLCRWPSSLQLQLDAHGGRFQMDAELYAPGWLELPGDGDAWPQNVSRDGGASQAANVAVIAREGHPQVQLPAGRYRLEGRWDWPRLPESLRLPPDAGLLQLKLDGRGIAHPVHSGDRLWLGRNDAVAAAQGNHLALKVFRLVDDDVPPRLSTVIELEIAGDVREERIGPVLPPGWTALSIASALPVHLEDDGRLSVQARPGLWRIELMARAAKPLLAVTAPAPAESWPKEEVWSFRARPELRRVDLAGAPAIDPRQTQMPDEWRELPAFLLGADAALTLSEQQRGQMQADSDELSLERQIWLDFDGRGYTVQDHLAGRLQSRWRLEAAAPLLLGQVLVDGAPQLITRQGEGVGVEVRRGQLELTADSRIEGAGRRMPAHGWNVDMQSLSTTLHLPPAWRLFAASGVDQVPGTWMSQWTLLDLFVVLIAAIAASRLFGAGTGLLSLLTLVLIWHEPGAPRWSWINLIAALALLQALPPAMRSGALGLWLSRYRWIAAAAVLLIALPFAIQQARLALYPQLELTSADAGVMPMTVEMEEMGGHEMPMPASAPMAMVTAARQAKAENITANDAASTYGAADSLSRQSIQQLDPRALTQTGPGLPKWQWRELALSWSGPVTGEQTLHLWLIPPWLTRSLQLLSLALIALSLSRWLASDLRMPRITPAAAGATTTLILALSLSFTPRDAQAQVVEDASMAEPESAPESAPPVAPTPDLLAQLRERLLAPPDCAPACATLSRLRIAVQNERLILRLSVDAAYVAGLALPLPFLTPGEQNRVWQPASLRLGDRALDTRRDEAGRLWAALPAGHSELTIEGPLAGFSSLSLPLPAKPQRVEAEVGSWQLGGVDELGRPAEALQLLRPVTADQRAAEGAAQNLPPLWQLTRELRLGLDWEVATTLQRLGAAHEAAAIEIPLLAGERPIGENLRSRDGRLLLSFAPGQLEAHWTSRLAIVDRLQLTAASRDDLFETWRFDISSLWHAQFSGLPAIGVTENEGWLPVYRPWPGESLNVEVGRPAGVPGQTLTLDHASLSVAAGQRVTDLALTLQLRASQGGSHRLSLPEGWSLQSLSIDGRPQSARLDAGQRDVVLALHPGAQSVDLKLRGDQGLRALLRTPALNLGLAGVNADLAIELPADRWVLYAGGPRLGPAVLFWGVLGVLIAVAFALGRVPLTPLRGWQWALLMIGLSQIPVWAAAVVAGWLIAIGARGRYGGSLTGTRFNAMQVLLALWTALALSLLFSAVAAGLLGSPDMQISGNGSMGNSLHWYQDRYEPALPRAWVLSVSIWVYRVLMLLWALWLANALLGWLRWGWDRYSDGGLWKKSVRAPVVFDAPAKDAAEPAPDAVE